MVDMHGENTVVLKVLGVDVFLISCQCNEATKCQRSLFHIPNLIAIPCSVFLYDQYDICNDFEKKLLMKPVGKRGGPFPYAGEQICLFDLLTFRCF